MWLALALMLYAAWLLPSGASAASRLPCSQEKMVGAHIAPDATDVSVSVRNDTIGPVKFYTLNAQSQRHYISTAEADAVHTLATKVGEVLLIADGSDGCVGIYRAETPAADSIDVSPDPVDYQETSGPSSGALELLARAVKCPVAVRTIPDPFSGEQSKTWEESRQARFFGSDSRFDLLFHKQQFDTSQDSGVLMFRTLRETLGTTMRAIGSVTQANAVVTVACAGGAPCMTDDIIANPDRSACAADDACESPTKGWYRSETITSPSKTNIRFCDAGAAADATAALKYLLQPGN